MADRHSVNKKQEGAAPSNPPSDAPVAAPTPGRPLSVQEKLAAARGGTATAQAATTQAAAARSAGPTKPTANESSAEGRPLTIKEKLAAARGGASSTPAQSPVSTSPDVTKSTPATPAPAERRPLTIQEKLAAARGVAAPPKAPASTAAVKVPPTAADAAEGRPLSIQEKLAAARGGAVAKPREDGGESQRPMAGPRPAATEAGPKATALAARTAGAGLASAAAASPTPAALLPAAEAERRTMSAPSAAWRGLLSVALLLLIGWGTLLAGIAVFAATLGRLMIN